MNAYFAAWRRLFDYRGRSTRSEFWLFTLFAVILAIVALTLDEVMGTAPAAEDEVGLFGAIVLLLHILPSISVTVRRMHDIDKSGWFLLIGLIPVIGIIVLLVFACMGSSPGANRFGPHPRDMREPTSARAQPRVGDEPPAAAAPRQSASGQPPLDQLEKLAALKTAGAIDDAEFQRMKADLLAKAAR
jgi:uncharacterized membrane protein YhaH (DUF805 family)